MNILESLKKYTGGVFRLSNKVMNRWLCWDVSTEHWNVYESRDQYSMGELICSTTIEDIAVSALTEGTPKFFEN